MDYTTKTYGRNDEVAYLYKMFEAGRDVSMPGPRRLGKTFVLDRLVDASPARGWSAVKVELAGCADSRSMFREMCVRMGSHRPKGKPLFDWLSQHVSQLAAPRTDPGSTWQQALLNLDHETYFERLLKAMHGDQNRRWLLLIDELPIALKALHDKGDAGVAAARDIMNHLNRLRQQYPKVRWMITGSIGIEPLARSGNYLGALAKFQPFELHPLTTAQAKDYLQDAAQLGHFPNRKVVTDAEAQALCEAVGWPAVYYLDALAQKLKDPIENEREAAVQAVEAAVAELLQPTDTASFGPWEEHLNKHYRALDRDIAFTVLGVLARGPHGAHLDDLLAGVGRSDLHRDTLKTLLLRLHSDGFVTLEGIETDSPNCRFRNPLLRLWWQRYTPQAMK